MQTHQIDVAIRYTNETNNTFEFRYIESHFLQQPNANVLLEKIKEPQRNCLKAVYSRCQWKELRLIGRY